MTDDLIARAKAAHARRWEVPGPAYRDPVPTGVVELGDWASEYLPELLAEVERLRGALDQLAGEWEQYNPAYGDPALTPKGGARRIRDVLRGDQ